uniref:DUF6818 domain-containing protein n=1 Tax=Globisporangium ultimum (strain ATCC 200006 / CBS 805.95 / DAOM BR144) TaxID=431595 RepID=K3X1I4_GLOUD
MQRRGGRVPGAEGYSKADVRALLRCLREVLPVNGDEWDVVLRRYRDSHATPNARASRDSTSLRTKFRTLTNAKKRSSDPTCPPEVRDARRIQIEISEKAGFGEEDGADNHEAHYEQASVESHDREDDNDSDGHLSEEGDFQQDAEQRITKILRRHATRQSNGADPAPQSPREDVPDAPAPASQPAGPGGKQKATASVLKRKRSDDTLELSLHQHLKEQALYREVTASERFLQLQLESEREAKHFERDERRTLAQKLERMEEVSATLRDKVDELREKNTSLQLENIRLHAELSALRANRSVGDI